MSEVEHPEDEQRREDEAPPAETTAADAPLAPEAAVAPESPAAAEEEPIPAEAATEPAEAATEPAEGASAPAEPASAASEEPPGGQEASASQQPATSQEPPTAEEPPVAQEPPAAEGPSAAAPSPPATAEPVEDEDELVPRAKPAIPGADLEPDIVPEGEQFLDAEARAAAEAEAEAAAAHDQEPEEETQPIADAAIDLAAGARYTSTGKRKTAVARVILKPGAGTYSINGKLLDDFFPRPTLQRMIRQPLETVGYEQRMDVVARMHGGGVAAQAGALRHGISRALLVADPNLRGELKRRGFLTRDPRVKERKKAGLKKARKRPQFSKR